MKVKLRVPLSTTPRQTASPLSNARGPEDMEIDGSAARPPNQPAAESEGEGGDGEEDEDEDDDEEDEEGDELDELDELEDEVATPAVTASNQASPKRSRITIKPRAPRKQHEDASPSPTPSSNAREPGSRDSPNSGKAGSATPSERARALTGKRAGLARQAEAARMTTAELDALPAAKRRKNHKARGAPGPGRGWRKGLTKGQKPVYELPGGLREAETTPSSFGNTSSAAAATTGMASGAASSVYQRASSLVPQPNHGDTSNASVKRSAPLAAVKIHDASGTRTHISDLSAKQGTAKNPGFRYPPLPSSRGGPPILPIAKIPISFQGNSTVNDKASAKKAPRSWTKNKREFLSLGGRLWSVPTWYGGEDKGFERKVDPSLAPVLAQSTAASASGNAVTKETPTPTPTPAPPAASTTAAGGAATATPSAAPRAGAASSTSSRLSPDKAATERSATGTASPLPPPRHVGAVVKEDVSWRGQSPAFLAGGR